MNGQGVMTYPNGTTGPLLFHNGSFVESTAGGQYQKEAANAPMDNLIGTALKVQGLANTINRIGGLNEKRTFVGKGSPPLNSFNKNNVANKRYFDWAF